MNKILQGNCLDVLKTLEDNSVDSIVTDPPYELGFMGKSWDNTGIAYSVSMWSECLRVLKPGGHLLAFSGTRTYHRMAVAIEDAGFEVRDMIEWVYGSGFPKSLNIGKAVDKLQGNEREVVGEREVFGTARKVKGKQGIGASYTSAGTGVEFEEHTIIKDTKGTSEWEGWGTALKPSHEPICMARKPLAEKTVAENVLKYGTGGINIDESRIPSELPEGRKRHGGGIVGNGTSYEMPDSKGEMPSARFPANLIHDNSEEVRECFPETKPTKPHGGDGGKLDTQEMGWGFKRMPCDLSDNGGNASRFFKSILYYPKASKSERNKGLEDFEEVEVRGGGGRVEDGYDLSDPEQVNLRRAATAYGAVKAKKANIHPTVKPIALMEYLIKMVTPKGGVVLDPFAGSGSTLIAAKQNKFQYIGIELDPEYIKIAEARLNSVRETLI